MTDDDKWDRIKKLLIEANCLTIAELERIKESLMSSARNHKPYKYKSAEIKINGEKIGNATNIEIKMNTSPRYHNFLFGIGKEMEDGMREELDLPKDEELEDGTIMEWDEE